MERRKSILGLTAVLFAAVLLLAAAPASASYYLLNEWGHLGSGDGEFAHPTAIAIDSQDNVYVSDYEYCKRVSREECVVVNLNHRVQKFDPNGTFLDKFGGPGAGDGEFDNPSSLAIDSQDNVYVADNPAQVQKFDSSGTFLESLGNIFPGFGLASDSEDNLYLADTHGHRIQKFDSSGTFLRMWGYGVKDGSDAFQVCTSADAPCQAGDEGAEDGQLWLPWDLATDSKDNVYVVDHGNDRIQKFDPSGAFLAKWGSYGSGDSQFRGPLHIATDTKDDVYVADQGINGIKKFDSSGAFRDSFGSSVAGSVATDSQDNVYVVSGLGNQVQVFTTRPQTTITSGPEGLTGDAAPMFRFIVNEQGSTTQCRLDSQPFSACISPKSYSTLPDGPHTFGVKATDSEGDTETTPAERSFTVDTALDGSAAAKQTQIKRGGDIRVRVRVTAQEPLTAEASGRIKVNPSYKLKPKTMQVAGASSKTMQLVPKKKHGKKIAKALKKGKKEKAKLTVKLTDEAGNRKTKKLTVKLKR